MIMVGIVVYDIVRNRHRARLRRFLKEIGIHAQKSVFECRLDDQEIRAIRRFCLKTLDLDEDSVRIYRVCEHCYEKAIIQGQGLTFSNLDWRIF